MPVVQDLYDRLSVEEWIEWEAYCNLEPFGPPAAFWQAGLIASKVHNLGLAKGQPPVTPEQLMPASLTGRDKKKRGMTQAQISQTLRGLARGGRS